MARPRPGPLGPARWWRPPCRGSRSSTGTSCPVPRWSGSPPVGRAVDVLVGTNVDDWRLWLVVSGAIGQITDEILTGPVRAYGYQSLAAYGLDARDGARRLPGQVPEGRPGRPARGGPDRLVDAHPRHPPGRRARRHARQRRHVHVRVRVALPRAGRRARARGPVRLRHGEPGRAAVRPAARPGPTAGPRPHHARRMGRLRHRRRPGLARVRPRAQGHDAVRHRRRSWCGTRGPGSGRSGTASADARPRGSDRMEGR